MIGNSLLDTPFNSIAASGIKLQRRRFGKSSDYSFWAEKKFFEHIFPQPTLKWCEMPINTGVLAIFKVHGTYTNGTLKVHSTYTKGTQKVIVGLTRCISFVGAKCGT